MPNYTFTPLSLVIAAAMIMALLLAFVCWQRRQAPGAIWFALLLVAFSWEYVFYALEIASPTVNDQLLWAKLQYLSIPFQGVLIFLSFQAFARIGVITRQTMVALLIIPLITVFVAWTNETHELLWNNYRLVQTGPVTIFTFEVGSWYIVNLIYNYALVVIGTGMILFRYLTTDERIYRNQLGILLLSSVLLFALNLSYVAGLVPYGLDSASFAFLPMSLVIAWGLFYYQLWERLTLQDRSVLQNMQDGIIILDTQQRIVDLNPAASALFTTARVGQPVQDTLPADWLIDFDPQTERLTEVSRQYNHQPAFYEVRVLPLYGQLDKFEGTLIMVREITRRKQAEQEREQTIEELGAFAHTVAHDLKAPLTVIVGHASTLADPPTIPPIETQSTIITMNETSQQMAVIIDELLLLASLNQQNPAFAAVELNKIIENVTTHLQPLITDRQVQLNSPQQWPPVVSYAPWIEKVMSTFISNAITFGGQPPCVTIGANRLPSNHIRLWVQDNGPGISPAEREYVFSPQTGKTTNRGLSLVQRIAARLGGEATVESPPGQGSIFSLILPDQSAPIDKA